MSISRRFISIAGPISGWVLLFWGAAAYPQAIVGTADVGAHAWIFPTPALGLPTPDVFDLTSIPADAQPHGVAIFGPRLALLGDFDRSRILVVDPGTGALENTIPTPAWRGLGSIALSPNGAVALASGDDLGVSSGLLVVENPFAAAPIVRTLALPALQHVHSWQTDAIRFAPDGRAFVATHHQAYNFGFATPNASFVQVIDPPYTAVAASIALPVTTATTVNFDHAEGLALSPDGATVLVTNGDQELYILRAPFAAGMPVETLPVGSLPIRCGSAAAPLADGSAILVTDYCIDHVTVLFAPYTTTAGAQVLSPTGGAATAQGFEHVAVAEDGGVAYVTGNVSTATSGDLWVIEAPFTLAGATEHAVVLPANERGAGAVELAGSKLFFDTFSSGDTSLWSSVTP